VNNEKGIILTASRDGYACIINYDTFEVLNKFHPLNPTRNLNTCRLETIENPDFNEQNEINDSNAGVAECINNINLFVNKQNSDKLSKQNSAESTFSFFNDIVSIDLDNLFDFNNNSLTSLSKSKKKEKFITLAIISGGQDSKLVTTTNAKEGGFEIIIYNAIQGNELANFQAHFGPVNTLSSFNNILASGAEDATVRLHKIDSYLFPIDKNK